MSIINAQVPPPLDVNPNSVIDNVVCDTDVFIGAAVIMNSNIASNGLADNINTSNIIGIVVSKPTANLCNIRVAGLTNSIFSGLDETKEYFLSDVNPGEITTISPIDSGHVVVKVGQPFNSTQFLFLKEVRVVRS